MIWLPSPPPLKTEKERQLADRRGGGRGRLKTYDGEKAWSSINHSILSGFNCRGENITYEILIVMWKHFFWHPIWSYMVLYGSCLFVNAYEDRHYRINIVKQTTLIVIDVSAPPPPFTTSANSVITTFCAADFSLLNLPKGKSLGRSKPATNS